MSFRFPADPTPTGVPLSSRRRLPLAVPGADLASRGPRPTGGWIERASAAVRRTASAADSRTPPSALYLGLREPVGHPYFGRITGASLVARYRTPRRGPPRPRLSPQEKPRRGARASTPPNINH